MSRWPGGLINKTPVTPTGPLQTGTAPGVWSMADAAYWTKQGLWPTAGNVGGYFGAFTETGGNPQLLSVDVDSAGNVYLSGAATTGGGGGYDAVVIKLSKTFDLTWQKRIGRTSTDQFYAVSVTSAGNVVASGRSYASPAYAGLTSQYDSSGTLSWQRTATDGSYDINVVASVADGSGNIYTAASETSTSSGLPFGKLRKINSSGTQSWAVGIGPSGSAYNSPIAVKLTSAGSPFVLYRSRNGSSQFVDYGVTYDPSTGSVTASYVILRYGTSPIGADGVLDASDNVISVATDTNASQNRGQVMKVNSSGTFQWGWYSTTNQTDFYSVDVDSSGNVYVLGRVDLGGGVYSPIVYKFNSSGTFQWARTFSVGAAVTPTKIKVSGSKLYFTFYKSSVNCYVISYLTDGTVTGTYGGVTIATASNTLTSMPTQSSSSVSSSGAVTIGLATSTLTEYTNTFTLSATAIG